MKGWCYERLRTRQRVQLDAGGFGTGEIVSRFRPRGGATIKEHSEGEEDNDEVDSEDETEDSEEAEVETDIGRPEVLSVPECQ